MEEHARAEQRLQHLFTSSMVLVVPPATRGEAVDGEFLLRAAQPVGSRRVVWQEEDEEEGGEEGDDAFDDEEPSEPLEARGAIDVADSVGDCAAEGAREVAEGDDEGDANGALVVAVPDGDEVDDAFAPTMSALRSSPTPTRRMTWRKIPEGKRKHTRKKSRLKHPYQETKCDDGRAIPHA